jgi:hypothetical protein
VTDKRSGSRISEVAEELDQIQSLVSLVVDGEVGTQIRGPALVVALIGALPVGIAVLIFTALVYVAAYELLGRPTGTAAGVLTIAFLAGSIGLLFVVIRFLVMRLRRPLRWLGLLPPAPSARSSASIQAQPLGTVPTVPSGTPLTAARLAELNARLADAGSDPLRGDHPG